jgi:hypothetical protein
MDAESEDIRMESSEDIGKDSLKLLIIFYLSNPSSYSIFYNFYYNNYVTDLDRKALTRSRRKTKTIQEVDSEEYSEEDKEEEVGF